MKFPPKIPNRKTKSKTNKGGVTQANLNESLEISKLDSSIISEGKIANVGPQIQALSIQKAAAGNMSSVLQCSFFLMGIILVKQIQRVDGQWTLALRWNRGVWDERV